MGEAIVEGLEEPADLVLVGLCTRKYYYCLAKIEGQARCRFFISELMIFGNIPWKLLSKQVPLQMFVHMSIKPHLDKPPRASHVADRFTK